uniref:Uncharacterized protein n=1 Tax=Physcomitrium patens TaxID=3218 RepID=A0A2K1KVP5_PHYPA|nr:hypothetical protein PHYPA_004861 [Physcomitrium patens]
MLKSYCCCSSLVVDGFSLPMSSCPSPTPSHSPPPAPFFLPFQPPCCLIFNALDSLISLIQPSNSMPRDVKDVCASQFRCSFNNFVSVCSACDRDCVLQPF